MVLTIPTNQQGHLRSLSSTGQVAKAISILKGKAKVKVTASGKKVSYGQAGKAKGGGPRVRAGTSKGDSYCARSLGIKKGLSKKKQNDPNTPNNLSRKRWKCSGAKSKK